MTFVFPAEGLTVDELLVRLPRDEDIADVAPAFQDPAVGGEASMPPLTEDELRASLSQELPELIASARLIPLVIVERTGDRLLGGASFTRYDPTRDTIELGYWLFLHGRGRGVATRVVCAMTDHAFAQGVLRIEAIVRVGNVASERVLERAGFTREGVMRSSLPHAGTRVDATLFSLLPSDRP